jgi:heptosyltransferase-2
MAALGSVVVVRTPNWLGDTVMALPALRALRRAAAAARLMVVGRWAPLLAGQGVGDLLMSYPGRLGERIALGRTLRAQRSDLAVLLPNSLESALAAWGWRARRRLGFDTDARHALLTDAVPRPEPRLHQADEYAALVGALGVQVGDATPTWTLESGPRADEAQVLLAEAGIAPGVRIVGLHLGAAFGASKRWPPERLGELAARLGARGLAPLLLGSREDQPTAAAVLAAARRPPRSLVGRDHAGLLPWLLSRLACLVSGDTGVAHLAAALGVPTVTLFGPTDPRLTAPRSPLARVLHRPVPCAPCFLETCPIDHVCMRGIAVDEVERAVSGALGA